MKQKVFASFLLSMLLFIPPISSAFVEVDLPSTIDEGAVPDVDKGALTEATGGSDELLTDDVKTKLKTPIQNLMKTTSWSLFLKEFELNMKTGFCGKGLDRAIGIKAHMIEPIGYFETSKKPLYFPFGDIDLKGNILKSGMSRSSVKEESGRDDIMWSHFVYFPIMGMIFKKKIPIFCFAKGELKLPLISEFNPAYVKDLMGGSMLPHMLMAMTPQGLLSTVLDCAATTANNSLRGFKSAPEVKDSGIAIKEIDKEVAHEENYTDKGEEYLKFVRNTMHYSVGCLGFAPIGGYIPAQDPGMDNEILLYGAINLLHGASTIMPSPFLYKQTNFNMSGKNIPAIPDTMCAPKKFAMGIKSQYVPMRVFPTVGDPHEMGMTPSVTTTMANVPGSKDQFVNIVWQRRDYYAFAYLCPGDD